MIGRQIAKGAGWTVGMKLCQRALGLVSTLVLARLLVPSDFGLIAMATSIFAVLEALTAFGFDAAIIHRQVSSSDYLNSAWTLNVIIGAFNALALLIAIPLAVGFYNEPRIASILWVVAACSAIGGFRNIGLVLYEQAMDFSRVFAIALYKKLTTFAVTLSFALYLQNYWALVVGMLTGAIADLLLSYWLHPYRPRLSLSRARELLHFSKWLLVNNVLFFLNLRGSDFIIGKAAGATALGTYSVAYEVANLPTSELVHPVMRAVFPAYARLASVRDDLRSGYLMVFRMVTTFSMPAAAGIACLAEPIVAVLLGPKWTAAVPLIQILAFFGAVRALQANVGSVYLALGQPAIPTFLGALYAVVALSSVAVAVAHYDLVAAAWALLASNIFTAVITFGFLLRKLQLSLRSFLSAVIRPVAASAMMAVVLLAALSAFPGGAMLAYQFVALLGLVTLGACTYVLVLVVIWFIAGRPSGAETDLWNVARAKLGRA
jgi:O-antigen/teichoic acid export membrane protein